MTNETLWSLDITAFPGVGVSTYKTSSSFGNVTNNWNWTETQKREYLGKLSLQSWNNRKPVVSYLSLLSIIGLVGNTLSFVVYHRRYRPSSTRVFVLSMSACELVINLLGLPLQITTIRYAYDSFNIALCRTFYVFATIPTQASGFYLILVAYDRYRHICHPFGRQLTAGQTWRLVGGASLLALLLFLPFTPFYGWHSVDTPVPGVKAVMCWIHDPIRNTPYPLAYNIVVGLSLFLGLFFIAVLYTCIGVHVFRHQMKMRKFFSGENSSSKAFHHNTLHSFKSTSSISSSGGVTRESTKTKSSNRLEDGKGTLQGDLAVSTISLSLSLSSAVEINVSEIQAVGDGAIAETKSEVEVDPCQNHGLDSNIQEGEIGQADRVKEPRGWNRVLSKLRHSVKSNRAVRSRTTFMMTVITGLYIINWLPHFAMRIMSNKPANMCDNMTDCGYNVYGLCIRSYFINSASNGFIYCICNPRFRQQVRLLLARKARL